MTDGTLQGLRSYLSQIPPGVITDAKVATEIPRRLSGCWDLLDGGNDEGMTGAKVNRIEEISWEPPHLRFKIERHGATVQGSSRAELHRWTVDMDDGRAIC